MTITVGFMPRFMMRAGLLLAMVFGLTTTGLVFAEGVMLYLIMGVAFLVAMLGLWIIMRVHAEELDSLASLVTDVRLGSQTREPHSDTTGLREAEDALISMNKELKHAAEEHARLNTEHARELQRITAEQEASEAAYQAKLAPQEKSLKSMYEISLDMSGDSESLGFLATERVKNALLLLEQANFLQTTLEEVTHSISAVEQLAGESTNMSQSSLKDAHEGNTLVRQAVKGIEEVTEAASGLSIVLQSLNTQADAIGDIIGMINDIADQTNLLALNAAIEAARAGESGRGFAVVADEVRKLAEKTMGSTQQVREVVNTIRALADKASRSMQDTGQRIGECSRQSMVAGESIERIMAQTEGMTKRMEHIAGATLSLATRTADITHAQDVVNNVATNAKEGALRAVDSITKVVGKNRSLLDLIKGMRGVKTDPSKIPSDKGKMRGILPSIMRQFILETYGVKTLGEIMNMMGNPDLLPSETFPNSIMHLMVGEICRHTGDSERTLYFKFARFTCKSFQEMYGQFLTAKNLKEFYLNLDVIHTRLTAIIPGIVPPHFKFVDEGKTLHITYESDRALFDYFEGILIAMAETFKESVHISMQRLDNRRARASVTFN